MSCIDDDMNTKFKDEKHRFLSNIVFTANWIKHRFEEFIKPFGISPQQFNILRILRGAKDWLSMNEVKDRMVEKSPNATRLCDKLLEKGLLERVRCEADRRMVHLRISQKGLDLLQEIDDVDEATYANFKENVSDEEARLVTRILDKLRS